MYEKGSQVTVAIFNRQGIEVEQLDGTVLASCGTMIIVEPHDTSRMYFAALRLHGQLEACLDV